MEPAEEGVELDCMSRPPCYIFSKLLQERQGTLAPSMMDGIGNISPWNQDVIAQFSLNCRNITWFSRFVDNLIANQVADVGNNPILTGLDEPVLIELRNVIFDNLHLLSNDT